METPQFSKSQKNYEEDDIRSDGIRLFKSGTSSLPGIAQDTEDGAVYLTISEKAFDAPPHRGRGRA